MAPGAPPLALDLQLVLLSNCACAEIQRGGSSGLEAGAALLERVSEAGTAYVRCAWLVALGGLNAADEQLTFFTGWRLALRVGKLQRSLTDSVAHAEKNRVARRLVELPVSPSGPAAVASSA